MCKAPTYMAEPCPQAARNYHAMLAARALGRLAGLLLGSLASGPCEAARTALAALLTPALAAQLGNPDPRPLLVHLNSSLLNPQAGDRSPHFWLFISNQKQNIAKLCRATAFYVIIQRHVPEA